MSGAGAGEAPLPPPGGSPWRRLGLGYAHPGAGRAWGLVLLGLLLGWLALPPGPLPVAILVADVPFLWLLGSASAGRWKRWAFLFGALHFAFLLRWLGQVHPVQVVAAGVFLGPTYLLAGFAIRWLGRRRVPWLLAVPTVLVFEEILRTVWLGGMPWPARSLSFVGSETYVASAAFVGAYGLSFLAALTSAFVARLPVLCRDAGRRRLARVGGALAAPAVVALALFVGGRMRLDAPDLETSGDDVMVAVQGSILQSLKHSRSIDAPQRIFHQHLDLSEDAMRRAAGAGRRVFAVLWPETMIPTSWEFVDADLAGRFPDVWENEIRVLQNVARAGEVQEPPPLFLLGAIHRFRRGDERHPELDSFGTHDSLFLIDPAQVPRVEGAYPEPPLPGGHAPWQLGRHDKRVLVPGGEYTPLGEVLPPLRWFRNLVSVIPELDPGAADQEPFLLRPGARAGTIICFEIAFPARCRAWREAGAGVLLNAANYGWFGETGFRAQIRAVAALRAAETATCVVMAGNTGPTVFFDPRGRSYGETLAPGGDVVATPGADAATFRPGWVSAPLRTDPEPPPYVRWGDLPWFLLGGLTVALAALPRRSPKPLERPREAGIGDPEPLRPEIL